MAFVTVFHIRLLLLLLLLLLMYWHLIRMC